MKLRFLLRHAALLLPTALFAQGDLDPSGPPAPTMKSLDQIQAGNPIGEAPMTIDTPGFHYLTGNLMITGQTAAIEITSSDVTLDLNGFLIAAPAGSGIVIEGGNTNPVMNVVVRNGHVHSDGVGVQLVHTAQCVVEDLSVVSDSDDGIQLSGFFGQNHGNRIQNCAASGGDSGIALDSASLEEAIGECSGNVIRSCVVESTDSDTLSAEPGLAIFGMGESTGNRVEDCVVTADQGPAILLSGERDGILAGNTVRRCAVANSAGDGILVRATRGGRAEGNDVSLCVAYKVSGTGIGVESDVELNIVGATVRGNRIDECVASETFDGFRLSAEVSDDTTCLGNAVTRCVASSAFSTGVGIGGDGNLARDNHVFDALGGVSASSGRNLIIRNSVGAVTGPAFPSDTENTRGPTLTSTGTLGDRTSESHPWANFHLQQ